MSMKTESKIVAVVLSCFGAFLIGTYTEMKEGFGISWGAEQFSALGAMLAGMATIAAAGAAIYAAVKWQHQIHYKEQYSAIKAFKGDYIGWASAVTNLSMHIQLRYHYKLAQYKKPYYLNSKRDRVVLLRLIDDYHQSWRGIRQSLMMLKASDCKSCEIAGEVQHISDYFESFLYVLEELSICDEHMFEAPCKYLVNEYRNAAGTREQVHLRCFRDLDKAKLQFDSWKEAPIKSH